MGWGRGMTTFRVPQKSVTWGLGPPRIHERIQGVKTMTTCFYNLELKISISLRYTWRQQTQQHWQNLRCRHQRQPQVPQLPRNAAHTHPYFKITVVSRPFTRPHGNTTTLTALLFPMQVAFQPP